MTDRDATIHDIRKALQRRSSPRLHMLALVSVTAAVGLLSSFLLLEAGLTAMVVRYPIAVLLAYTVFLGLVALWLRRFRLRARDDHGNAGIQFDVLELPFDAMWKEPSVGAPHFGGGGGFSGGGASAAFDAQAQSSVQSIVIAGAPPASVSASSGGSGSGTASGALDLDGDAALLIPAAVLAAIAFSAALYDVYIAPALFAELLLDAGLAAGLYRRLRRIERRDWLTTAIRHTALPAIFIAALLALSGLVMQSAYPDAVSIGRVVDHVLAARKP